MAPDTKTNTIPVMLVDGDEKEYLLIRYLLGEARSGSFQLDWCATYDAALEAMRGNTHQVFLVDHRVEQRSGLELLQDAIRGGCTQPVILFTHQGNGELAVQALQAGAMDCLEKGQVRPELLERSIRFALERQRALELRNRLSMSQHLASINRFTAGLAHQIRNPAAFVLTNLTVMRDHLQQLSGVMRQVRQAARQQDRQQVDELLEQGQVDQVLGELGEMVDENLTGMDRIEGTIADLTSLVRIERADVSMVRLNDMVSMVCRMVDKEIRPRARLVKELGTLPPIPADRGKLIKILMNLLLNATRAIEPGAPRDNTICITTACTAHGVTVAVEDSGSGISAAIRDRIFEPFFTTRPPGEGAGLGLSVSLEMARHHRGDITFESTVGQGSRFEVHLPVETGLVLAPRRHTGAVEPVSMQRRRVLVIEQELSLLKALQRLLSNYHDVVIARGGEQAIELLAQDTAFDVVICSLVMTRTTGEEVHEQLQRRAPELLSRLIFLSDGTSTILTQRFLTDMPDRILMKPVASDVLLEVIESVASDRRPGA